MVTRLVISEILTLNSSNLFDQKIYLQSIKEDIYFCKLGEFGARIIMEVRICDFTVLQMDKINWI